LIYPDDLTYFQYTEINQFINESISLYNKNVIERGRLFSALKSLQEGDMRGYFLPSLLLSNSKDVSLEAILEKYHVNPSSRMTSEEWLAHIMHIDQGLLFQHATALANIGLMYSEDMAALFEKGVKNEVAEKVVEKGECVKYEIAKAYHTEKELLADNDKEIYFDKEYDTTLYSMLSDYEKDMIKMSADDFIAFLVKKLKSRLKINDYEAEYLAETLIAGAKRVTEGQYAVFYDTSKAVKEEDSDSVGRIAQFYKRTHNKWVHDEKADETWFVADTSLLCNIQETCIEMTDAAQVAQDAHKKLLEKDLSFKGSKDDVDQVLVENKRKQIEIEFNTNKYKCLDII
jgi:hypothetical protein